MKLESVIAVAGLGSIAFAAPTQTLEARNAIDKRTFGLLKSLGGSGGGLGGSGGSGGGLGGLLGGLGGGSGGGLPDLPDLPKPSGGLGGLLGGLGGGSGGLPDFPTPTGGLGGGLGGLLGGLGESGGLPDLPEPSGGLGGLLGGLGGSGGLPDLPEPSGGLGGLLGGLGGSGGLPDISTPSGSTGGLGGLGGGDSSDSSGGSEDESGGLLGGLGGGSGGLGGLMGGFGSGGSTQNGVAEGGACAPLTFIFARGTGEMGNMGSVVGPPVASALQEIAGEVTVQGVDYPASAAGNMNMGGDGGDAMAKLVQQATSQCPETKVVLGGYSQGAMVVHNAAGSLEEGQVAGAVTFGDPLKSAPVQGVPADNFKTFCAQGDPVCLSGGNFMAHISYTGDAQEAAQFLAQAAGV